MLNITVNLSSEVSDILKYFGSIESVANKALKAISDGLIDLEGIPKYKFGTGKLKQFRITVDNPQYEEQYKMYGSHCNKKLLKLRLAPIEYIVEHILIL